MKVPFHSGKRLPLLVSPPSRSSRESGLAAILAAVERLQPALDRGDRAAQTEIIGRLLALEAPMGEQWQALAGIAAQNGELRLARTAIDRYVAARRADAYAYYVKAASLEQWGALGDAYDLLCTLPADVPDRASHAHSRGMTALHLGHVEEARDQLDLATRLNPQAGQAWLFQSLIGDLAQDPALADRIVGAERAMAAALPAQRASYFYALGKVHADRAEGDAAFAAFARGADEMRRIMPYDRAADRRHAEQSLIGYDRALIDAVAALPRSETTGLAMFVTGLPRSGTTLVEQILASHSTVAGGGELGYLNLLASEVGGHTGAAVRAYVGSRGVERPARLWNHWLAERFPELGRVVDKGLDSTRHIGLAAALLPEAPVVWMTRDPLDCAWSCFRTFFARSLPWSFDLADIAAHFRLEDALLARWQDILGERLLVVPYDGLVSEPAAWTRRILAHCGLAEEAPVFAPHATNRAVTTASVMQVRRPINRAGIGAAGPYRHLMGRFIDAYRD